MDLMYLAGFGVLFLLLVGLAVGCNKLGGQK